MKRSLHFIFTTALALCCLTVGLAKSQGLPGPVVPAVEKAVQPEMTKHLPDFSAKALAESAKIDQYTSRFRQAVRMKTAKDPWGGMRQFEQHGLRAATAARSSCPITATLDALAVCAGRPTGAPRRIKLRCGNSLEGMETIRRTLLEAEALHQQALEALTDGNRRYLFGQTTPLVQYYSPQIELTFDTDQILRHATLTLDYFYQRYQWAPFIGSAQTLAQLSDRTFQREMLRVFKDAKPVPGTVPGITGDILHAEATPLGWIIIGGFGDNSYTIVDQPVAAIIDLGGKDSYFGSIASSFDVYHANSLIIDFAGDDTYTNAVGDKGVVAFGLATGRLGVGMLIDCAGNDRYTMALGSGGTGFGGLGALCDLAGDDTYAGTVFTQGAAIGGIGLLLDTGGNDTHTSEMYSIGFGGCLGIGAVVDAAGADSYQCGKKYPSGYNATDCPSNDPKDPNFQYDGWGIGAGVGRRFYPFLTPEQGEYLLHQLAGGVGMVVDAAGNDKYDGSNFTQGCGYFFGAGLLLDLAGDDQHAGARYSNAAGAHQAMGLAVDYAGNDSYSTTGPTYFSGCAWDHSDFLCIDAAGDDKYQSARSSGFGLGDISSWGIFADLGGRDSYATPHGLGRASETGLGVFYTTALADYTNAPANGKKIPANGQTLLDGEGGLFVSRAGKK